MEITRRAVGGLTVLDLTGRLTVSPGEVEVAPLRAAIRELTRAGCVNIAVNLAGLTRLDARGLGELVVAMKTLRHHGGRLALVAPAPRVVKMLAVTGLDAVFERCDTEAQLVAGGVVPPASPTTSRRRLDMSAYA